MKSIQKTSSHNPKVRLMRDLSRIEKESEQEGVMASPDENDFFSWEALIFGPDNTPWEGGMFKLLLNFPEDYPAKPPKVKFISNVFHPNGKFFIYF